MSLAEETGADCKCLMKFPNLMVRVPVVMLKLQTGAALVHCRVALIASTLVFEAPMVMQRQGY